MVSLDAKGVITGVSSTALACVTEPFEMNPADRYSMTLSGQRELFSTDQAIKDIISSYIDKWSGLELKPDITVPVLDQSLIADDVGGEDQKKTTTALTNKFKGNNAIQMLLSV